MRSVAVLLSGCGVFDGSEIHEAVLTLLALSKAGVTYQCYAPDRIQYHVVNHVSGQQSADQSRNMLQEAGRIARGQIKPLEQLDVSGHSALILPGGFGVAKNLCNYAIAGTQMQIEPDVLAVCQDFANAGKPAGYLCISPIMLPLIYGKGVIGTLGTDPESAAAFTELGGEHHRCEVNDIVVDPLHQVVSTPAYMLAQRIDQAAIGIEKLVSQLITMCQIHQGES